MILSRSGSELNEIWYKQTSLLEMDERQRSRERSVLTNPNDEGARKHLVATLRRSNNHDEADRHLLQPHVDRFVAASRRLQKAEKADVAYTSKSGRHNQQGVRTKTGNERDVASLDMEDARGALHYHAGNALRAHGKSNPMLKARRGNPRYEVILAHGAKYLPKTDNWDDEHSLLSHYHDVKTASRGGVHHFKMESASKRYALTHSLVSRSPNLNVDHLESDDGHSVMVHMAPGGKSPEYLSGGKINDHSKPRPLSTEQYLNARNSNTPE